MGGINGWSQAWIIAVIGLALIVLWCIKCTKKFVMFVGLCIPLVALWSLKGVEFPKNDLSVTLILTLIAIAAVVPLILLIFSIMLYIITPEWESISKMIIKCYWISVIMVLIWFLVVFLALALLQFLPFKMSRDVPFFILLLFICAIVIYVVLKDPSATDGSILQTIGFDPTQKDKNLPLLFAYGLLAFLYLEIFSVIIDPYIEALLLPEFLTNSFDYLDILVPGIKK